MDDEMSDPTNMPQRRRLSDVVREAKIAAADRQDVVVDMKEADRGRLELLAEELWPILDEVPRDDDQFDFFLSSGQQPRLWIDAIAHVQMGTDRRTYRFVRDTRYGRVVMAESGDLLKIADSVTQYVAERMVQRQQFLAADLHLGNSVPQAPNEAISRQRRPDSHEPQEYQADRPVEKEVLQQPATVSPTIEPASSNSIGWRIVSAILWFAVGVAAAVGTIAAIFWDSISLALGSL